MTRGVLPGFLLATLAACAGAPATESATEVVLHVDGMMRPQAGRI